MSVLSTRRNSRVQSRESRPAVGPMSGLFWAVSVHWGCDGICLHIDIYQTTKAISLSSSLMHSLGLLRCWQTKFALIKLVVIILINMFWISLINWVFFWTTQIPLQEMSQSRCWWSLPTHMTPFNWSSASISMLSYLFCYS